MPDLASCVYEINPFKLVTKGFMFLNVKTQGET